MNAIGKSSLATALALAVLAGTPAFADGKGSSARSAKSGKGYTVTVEHGVRVLRPNPDPDRLYYDRPASYFTSQYELGAEAGSSYPQVVSAGDGGVYGLGTFGNGRRHKIIHVSGNERHHNKPVGHHTGPHGHRR